MDGGSIPPSSTNDPREPHIRPRHRDDGRAHLRGHLRMGGTGLVVLLGRDQLPARATHPALRAAGVLGQLATRRSGRVPRTSDGLRQLLRRVRRNQRPTGWALCSATRTTSGGHGSCSGGDGCRRSGTPHEYLHAEQRALCLGDGAMDVVCSGVRDARPATTAQHRMADPRLAGRGLSGNGRVIVAELRDTRSIADGCVHSCGVVDPPTTHTPRVCARSGTRNLDRRPFHRLALHTDTRAETHRRGSNRHDAARRCAPDPRALSSCMVGACCDTSRTGGMAQQLVDTIRLRDSRRHWMAHPRHRRSAHHRRHASGTPTTRGRPCGRSAGGPVRRDRRTRLGLARHGTRTQVWKRDQPSGNRLVVVDLVHTSPPNIERRNLGDSSPRWSRHMRGARERDLPTAIPQGAHRTGLAHGECRPEARIARVHGYESQALCGLSVLCA